VSQQDTKKRCVCVCVRGRVQSRVLGIHKVSGPSGATTAAHIVSNKKSTQGEETREHPWRQLSQPVEVKVKHSQVAQSGEHVLRQRRELVAGQI
jgi:hypothetical protein